MADGCYNHIYSVLVESDQDTLGIIAYSLYKRQKSSSSSPSKTSTTENRKTWIWLRFTMSVTALCSWKAIAIRRASLFKGSWTHLLPPRLLNSIATTRKGQQRNQKCQAWILAGRRSESRRLGSLRLLARVSRILYLESQPGAETGDRAGLRCSHHRFALDIIPQHACSNVILAQGTASTLREEPNGQRAL